MHPHQILIFIYFLSLPIFLSDLYSVIMKKSSSNTTNFSLVGLVVLLLLQRILILSIRIDELFSSFESFLQFRLHLVFSALKVWSERKHSNTELSSRKFCFHEKGDDGKICRGDVEIIMERLGMFCNPDGEKLQERWGLDELSVLFEEKEPSFEEVKEAFDVFDENKDGFIDARELQRVLCSLGFREASELEKCKRMIRAFDENGDGHIDFNEFVKFMENSFAEYN